MVDAQTHQGHLFVFFVGFGTRLLPLYDLTVFPSKGKFKIVPWNTPLKTMKPFPVQQAAEIWQEMGAICKKYKCFQGL